MYYWWYDVQLIIKYLESNKSDKMLNRDNMPIKNNILDGITYIVGDKMPTW